MYGRARDQGALFIVNQDLDAACEADGLHVGQEDLALLDGKNLRERLGRRILGISCSTPAEALEAERVGADYVGVGPFNATSSKGDAGPAIGEAGVRAVVRATRLPVAAIGGIGVADVETVARSGARMAAVISAIAKPHVRRCGVGCASIGRVLDSRVRRRQYEQSFVRSGRASRTMPSAWGWMRRCFRSWASVR